MHVLLLPTSYPRFYKPLSGIFCRDQANALRKSGLTVGVIDPSPRSVGTIGRGGLHSQRFQVTATNDHGIPVVQANDWCVPYARKIYARQFLSRAVELFRRYTEQFGNPDVIHAHGILWGGVAAREIGQNSGIPYIVTEHSGEYALSPIQAWTIPYVRSAIQDASIVLAVGSELANRLRQFSETTRVQVVPNVVDTDFFYLRKDRRASDPFVFATVASLVKHKGIETLLRAFAAASARVERLQLEIGGDGSDRATFQALAQRLGIADRVRWLGALTREQVRDCFLRADAFVLPSFYETFGVVFIEAMATGLPVIATRCGGPEDFVDANCGYLVDLDRSDQVAQAMTMIRSQSDDWRRRAPSIRQAVIDRFGERAIVQELVDIYKRSVASPPRVGLAFEALRAF